MKLRLPPDWRQRFFKLYHIVIYNEKTLEEKLSLLLTPMNIVFLVSILGVVAFIISFLLLGFTPLNRALPVNAASQGELSIKLLEMELRTDSLEMQVRERDRELRSLKFMIEGDSETIGKE